MLARLGNSMLSMDVALPRLHGLVKFFRFAPLAQLVVQHPAFLPKAVPNGRMLQGVSTLGVLLSLGASSSEPGFHNVLKGGGFARFEVENEVSRLRASFGSYQMLWRSWTSCSASRWPSVCTCRTAHSSRTSSLSMTGRRCGSEATK